MKKVAKVNRTMKDRSLDKEELKRCAWTFSVKKNQELYVQYHDYEWGKAVHDDTKLFESLILEGVQAGISWAIVLEKREDYRKAYDHFSPAIIAEYGEEKREALLQNKRLIRNRLKIDASITNAKAFLAVQKEFGTFNQYIWSFVNGKPIQNHWQCIEEIPTSTPISDAMSEDLKKRGFKWVGTTICYAYMQAVGLVNDHTTHCFRHPSQ